MSSGLHPCLLPLFAGLLAVGVAQAQTAPATAAADATPSPAQQADAAPASAAPAAVAARPASRNPDRRVIEDDQVRIEELRVRGQLRRVTVQSKVEGAREYEIIVGHGGRDPSQDRGNAGRSAWRILGF
jgi:hypothetical protein